MNYTPEQVIDYVKIRMASSTAIDQGWLDNLAADMSAFWDRHAPWAGPREITAADRGYGARARARRGRRGR